MDDLTRGTGSRVVQFDGSSAYVSAGNAEELQVVGAISLEACVRIQGDPRPGQRRMPHRNILVHGHDRVTEVFLRANLFSMQYEVGTWTADNDATFMARAKIDPGDFRTWIHLAGVFDGAAWRLYKNGTLVGEQTASVGAVRVRGSEWAVGAKGDGGDRYWKGSIAHASIWGRARSQAEIAASMGEGLKGNENGLLRYWQMDDGGGRSIQELTGPTCTRGHAAAAPCPSAHSCATHGQSRQTATGTRRPVPAASTHLPLPQTKAVIARVLRMQSLETATARLKSWLRRLQVTTTEALGARSNG